MSAIAGPQRFPGKLAGAAFARLAHALALRLRFADRELRALEEAQDKAPVQLSTASMRTAHTFNSAV